MGKIKILWTGIGFNIWNCWIINIESIIETIYVIDEERESISCEKEVIQSVIDALNSKKETKATVLGSQHEWLARLASIRLGLEVVMEVGNRETSHIIH